MRLNDEEIVQVLTDYVEDTRYKQAVLIDGEWGSGKTFFVKEKLLSELNVKFPERSAMYISLYGLNDFSQIMDEIYNLAFEKFFDKKIGDGSGEKIGKGLNFVSKVFSAGLKHFNINLDDLPSLSDIKQIKDTIIIFDDLERCNIDANQLLGFINNLVEHNNIKVILVANQAEIGRTQIPVGLAEKYLVALDSRIDLDQKNDSEKNSKGQENKTINKEQLIARTDTLFSEDILYNKIKEKLIGLTIYYKTDFDSIYDLIVEKYVKDEKAKENLKSNKQIVLNIFENQNHHNIRTLIFGMIAYEKFFSIIGDIDFEPDQYLKEQKEKVLEYTMELAIKIKSGNKVCSWKTSDAKAGLVYLKGLSFGKSIFGYEFVDTYLLYHHLNHEDVKDTIEEVMIEKKRNEDYKKMEEGLAYNKLYYWWELEDEEIIELLSKMKEELKEQKYSPRYFKDMIVTLMQMKSIDIDWFIYEDYIPLMRDKLENSNDNFEKRYIEILSDNDDFIQRYNKLAKPLFEAIDKKEKDSKKSFNYFLDINAPWDESFISNCEKNRTMYLRDKKFFFYMVPDEIIKKLKVSSVKEIYYFLNGIEKVYRSYNLNEFFKLDIANIQMILDKMDIKELSNNKHTRKIVLKKLEDKLRESLQLIES